MTEIRTYFVTFSSVVLLYTTKSGSSGQISTHFRLKIKSQDEFIV